MATGMTGGVVVGMIAMLLLSSSIDFIAQSFDSSGLERLFAAVYSVIYLLIVGHCGLFAGQSESHWRTSATDIRGGWLSAGAIIALVIALNGSNFLVYIIGYWPQNGAVRPLLLGMVLGLGICISIGILLYFSVMFCDQNIYRFTSVLLMGLYGAGQLNHAGNQLLQADLLPESDPLWNANGIISESSELGHFLTALLGYDATPTAWQLGIYLTGLALGIVFLLLKAWWQKSQVAVAGHIALTGEKKP
jgi:high-affinity iron transporter